LLRCEGRLIPNAEAHSQKATKGTKGELVLTGGSRENRGWKGKDEDKDDDKDEEPISKAAEG
jgi:hypothetical protein